MSDNTENHREGNGRFTPGCEPGPGRPRGASLRRQFWEAMRESDVRLAVLTLRRIMKSKSASNRDRLSAAVELLNRSIGTAGPSDLMSRVEDLEKVAEQGRQNGKMR
jgi:hypothetical protein